MNTTEMMQHLMSNPGIRAKGSINNIIVEYAKGDMRFMEISDRHKTVCMNRIFLKSKWTILPKYVPFEEAMKALKEGLVVRAYDGMDGGYYEFDGTETFTQLAKEYPVIKMYELTQMKWTITE